MQCYYVTHVVLTASEDLQNRPKPNERTSAIATTDFEVKFSIFSVTTAKAPTTVIFHNSESNFAKSCNAKHVRHSLSFLLLKCAQLHNSMIALKVGQRPTNKVYAKESSDFMSMKIVTISQS